MEFLANLDWFLFLGPLLLLPVLLLPAFVGCSLLFDVTDPEPPVALALDFKVQVNALTMRRIITFYEGRLPALSGPESATLQRVLGKLRAQFPIGGVANAQMSRALTVSVTATPRAGSSDDMLPQQPDNDIPSRASFNALPATGTISDWHLAETRLPTTDEYFSVLLRESGQSQTPDALIIDVDVVLELDMQDSILLFRGRVLSVTPGDLSQKFVCSFVPPSEGFDPTGVVLGDFSIDDSQGG